MNIQSIKGFTTRKKIQIENIILNNKQCIDQRKMSKFNEFLGNASFALQEFLIYQGIAKHSNYSGIGASITENYLNIYHYNKNKIKYYESIQDQFEALRRNITVPKLKIT